MVNGVKTTIKRGEQKRKGQMSFKDVSFFASGGEEPPPQCRVDKPLNRTFKVSALWFLQAFLYKQNMHTKTKEGSIFMFVGSKNKYQSRTRQGFFTSSNQKMQAKGKLYTRQLKEISLYYLQYTEISKGSEENVPFLNIFVNMEIPSNIHVKQLSNNFIIFADFSEISHRKSE